MAKKGEQQTPKTSSGRKRVSSRGKSQRTYQNSLKEAADMFGAGSFPAVGLASTPLPKAAQRIRMYVGI